ncbi:MAG: hypothetical protein WC333_02365 [Dehalococcoidia bacterium]|jgi:hypothetical protein
MSFIDEIHEKQNKRYADLHTLGMKFNGDSFVGTEDNNKDFNMHWTEISCDSDEEWNEKIVKMTTELKRRLETTKQEWQEKIKQNS